MASLEKNFWQEIRKKLKHYQWLRLESYATQGVPDLLGTTQDGMFFTVELKVTKSKTVKVSPHQIAFHVKHPKNTYICIEHLGSGTVKLFRGSQILELVACGLKLEACCLGLDACSLMLDSLGA